MAEHIEKVKFKCPHCGCRLGVSADRAGKQGKCPRCKERLTVPEPTPPSRTVPTGGGLAAASNPGPAELSLIPPVLDSTLLDLSRTQTPEPDPDESQETYEQLRGMEGRSLLKDKEEPPQRRLPWIIDIFLYPLNISGLLILGITAGIPLILRAILYFCMACSAIFPPLLIFWVLSIVVHWAGLLILLLYMNWYACTCIRDSAEGAIRAVNTASMTPGLGDLFVETFRVLACVLACVAPVLVYYSRTQRVDTVFWALAAIGGFALPMTLVAVTMVESIRGLNPIPLIRSILATFLPYCLLVPFCYVLLVLFPVAGYLVKVNWIPGYLMLFATYYVWLVLAHLLGRFCWKYDERLAWDA